jgi:dipeptidyl aminopeptidase/acylaminoacyl peptidase
VLKLLATALRPVALVLLCAAAPCLAQDASEPARTVTLEDLFSEIDLVDAAISQSGRYLAAIVRRESDDNLLIVDLDTGERKIVQRVGFDEAGERLLIQMIAIYWKSDDRMLLRTRVRPRDPDSFNYARASVSKLGDRLFSLDRTGDGVALLGETRNSALAGAFDLGAIMSFLPHDPKHILMLIDGFEGRSLFKVDIETGLGEQVERPSESVVGWWLDVEGNPVVRITASAGTVRLFRKDEQDRWRVFYRTRVREMSEREEYAPVGPSTDPNKYYVLAHPPGHDRIGLYLYDLENEEFGEPIIEHPTYDLLSAAVARDGSRVVRHCYLADVRVCVFSDPEIDAHMRALRKFFDDAANVYVVDSSEDNRTILLFVEGPHDVPAYYYYQTDVRDIRPVGAVRRSLDGVARPRASVVSWTARDGKTLSGYLTVPPNAAEAGAGKLPLIVYPHGGPEARDHLTFDPWVQYLAARGYAVFQPNFRGSDGFGRAFAESGYGEWGRKMQDDIIDGVQMLVDRGTVDPARACIVGISYGGYAALAAASLTPDRFKCAVSVAGISDLEDFIGWRKRNWGSDSDGYTYWLKAIGDPDVDEQKLREVSPARLVDRIKVPVLLIHGTDDYVVPIAQSRAMKKALDQAKMTTELVELEGEGHSGWSDDNEKLALATIDAFLWQHLGPGHGVTTPPAPTEVADP